MKALIISLILFVLAIGVVCANAVFIHNTAKKIKDLALSVTNGESEATHELTEYWNSRKKFVSLTVGLREVDSVSEQILKLCIYAELKQPNELSVNYVLLCNAVDDITRYERITLIDIF